MDQVRETSAARYRQAEAVRNMYLVEVDRSWSTAVIDSRSGWSAHGAPVRWWKNKLRNGDLAILLDPADDPDLVGTAIDSYGQLLQLICGEDAAVMDLVDRGVPTKPWTWTQKTVSCFG